MNLSPLNITIGLVMAAAFFTGGLFAGRQWPKVESEAKAAKVPVPGKQHVPKAVAGERVRPQRFRAITKFQINRSSAPDVISKMSGARGQSSGNWFETQLKTITARNTLLLAVKNLKLDTEWNLSPAEAATRLERMIEVEQERGTDIVGVIAWSDKREEAAALANGVRVAYEEWRRQIDEDRVRRLSEQIASQITQQEAEVDKGRLAMLDIMKRNNIVDSSLLSAEGQETETAAANGDLKDISDIVAERYKQSEYATARQRYEAQLLLLKSMGQHAGKLNIDESAIQKPIEVLEEAVAGEAQK